MINLTIGTNTQRTTVIVEQDETLQSILSDNNINVTGTALHLNGTLIAGVDTDKSLVELGIADGTSAVLISVIKADSAQ